MTPTRRSKKVSVPRPVWTWLKIAAFVALALWTLFYYGSLLYYWRLLVDLWLLGISLLKIVLFGAPA